MEGVEEEKFFDILGFLKVQSEEELLNNVDDLIIKLKKHSQKKKFRETCAKEDLVRLIKMLMIAERMIEPEDGNA